MQKSPIQHADVCAPAQIEHFRKTGTCMTLSDMQRIATDYNQSHPVSQHVSPRHFSSLPALRAALSDRFSPYCAGAHGEPCWSKQNFIRDRDRLMRRFRPTMPAAWRNHPDIPLTTTDILKGLKPYEDKYADFALLGVFAIDFLNKNEDGACLVYDQICRVNIPAFMKNGIRQFALVINLDPHDKAGSHWIAVYVNTDPKDPRFGFFHFCSEASPPSPRVQQLYEMVRSQYRSAFPRRKTVPPFWQNKTRYQFKNTECGMYAMTFVILCLEHPRRSVPRTLDAHLFPHSDDMVRALRHVIFRPPM